MPRPGLDQEALRVTEELGEVVFVGALAVNHYARFRESRDIDLATAGPLDEEKMRGLGYRKREGSRSSWYTPRGVQADFYTKDVGGVPVGWIMKTATVVRVGRGVIRVMSLEGLVVAKHRAGRSQDVADLRRLMAEKGLSIDWKLMSEVATELEISELKQVARALS